VRIVIFPGWLSRSVSNRSRNGRASASCSQIARSLDSIRHSELQGQRIGVGKGKWVRGMANGEWVKGMDSALFTARAAPLRRLRRRNGLGAFVAAVEQMEFSICSICSIPACFWIIDSGLGLESFCRAPPCEHSSRNSKSSTLRFLSFVSFARDDGLVRRHPRQSHKNHKCHNFGFAISLFFLDRSGLCPPCYGCCVHPGGTAGQPPGLCIIRRST
jgi:hypothetical protein